MLNADAVSPPGTALAAELLAQAAEDARRTPLDALLDAAGRGEVGEDACLRLLGRLWAMKRVMYYVYGGWAMGLSVNEYPPAVASLFGKQIHDDSTHEMQLVDEILRRGLARTQREVFRHPYCAFTPATRVAYHVFALRALVNYRQNIRVAALDLGAKVIEAAWLERFGRAFPDARLRAVFASQVPETRSHVLMGRLIVERHVATDVDAGLCRLAQAEVRRNYLNALEEIAAFTLAPHDAASGPAARDPAVSSLAAGAGALRIDPDACTACRMCHAACRAIDRNAVFIAPEPRHRVEIDPDRCAYPGCTVCLPYCPSPGAIVEAATGRSLVPPPPEVWAADRRWTREPA